ncbi:MAG TPA: hypothetical protein VFL76_07350 [Edaphocola sp.]|nr:hypothetical protein [Edaphocola sp.]
MKEVAYLSNLFLICATASNEGKPVMIPALKVARFIYMENASRVNQFLYSLVDELSISRFL